MASPVVTGTLGRDLFASSMSARDVTAELLRSFREYLEYHMQYKHDIAMDISIEENRRTVLRINHDHPDSDRISMSELQRMLDKFVNQFLNERG